MEPFVAPACLLLIHETLLAEACLASGLTAVRNAVLTDKGKLLSGFFQLSIGIERLFKLILVVDFMIENSLARPTNEWLKGFGHDLVELHNAVRGLHGAKEIVQERAPRETAILAFLSRFAKSSRYYNLNVLTEAKAGYNPLSEWGEILDHAIRDDVSTKDRERVAFESDVMATVMVGRTAVFMHDLNDQPLDMRGAVSQPQLQLLAAPHVVLRLFSILSPARQVLYELGHRGYEIRPTDADDRRRHIPDFADLLVFLRYDRRAILRKKRWS